MNEAVKDILKNCMWDLATCANGEPNVVPVVDTFKKIVEDMFKGAAMAKGALVITSERIIVTTPGADNKKVICG